MIQGTVVEEFVNGLDGNIHSDIEGLPGIFLEDKLWSAAAIAIAKEVATLHNPIIKSYDPFASWIKDVENATRPYRILEDNAPQRMWLEKTPGKSLVLVNGASPNWSSVLVLGEIGIDCPYMVGFRSLCAHTDEFFVH
ncbi:hypothetical protein N7493_000905 [Penicillium malachiteum]|uniref:Uncharacterized protein n=1 Tax=Penicillium malachiteum TaxID=1324776 RepID=A0AAD6HXX4_9EURO|nr:hypothetical protein N7493_000905 [Penicillium malachiteum]